MSTKMTVPPILCEDCCTVPVEGHDGIWLCKKHAAVDGLIKALKMNYELIDRIGRECQTPICISFEERDAARAAARAILHTIGEEI